MPVYGDKPESTENKSRYDSLPGKSLLDFYKLDQQTNSDISTIPVKSVDKSPLQKKPHHIKKIHVNLKDIPLKPKGCSIPQTQKSMDYRVGRFVEKKQDQTASLSSVLVNSLGEEVNRQSIRDLRNEYQSLKEGGSKDRSSIRNLMKNNIENNKKNEVAKSQESVTILTGAHVPDTLNPLESIQNESYVQNMVEEPLTPIQEPPTFDEYHSTLANWNKKPACVKVATPMKETTEKVELTPEMVI